MDVMPVIQRQFTAEDRDMRIVAEPYNTVTHSYGFGESGRKVQVTEHECPCDSCHISMHRMVRLIHVNVEEPNTVKYWCMNPNCKHFLRDELSWAFKGSYPDRVARTPEVTDTVSNA